MIKRDFEYLNEVRAFDMICREYETYVYEPYIELRSDALTEWAIRPWV